MEKISEKSFSSNDNQNVIPSPSTLISNIFGTASSDNQPSAQNTTDPNESYRKLACKTKFIEAQWKQIWNGMETLEKSTLEYQKNSREAWDLTSMQGWRTSTAEK